MKKLKLVSIDNIDYIVKPDDFEQVTLNSPATSIFTDFKRFNPSRITENTKAIDALDLMLKTHVHLNLVISENDDFVGVITHSEVSEQAIMHEITLGNKREEILVSDLMLPKEKIMTFDISQLKRATVEDVINTLKQNGLHHCLVMDTFNHHIRGIISSKEIERKLHIPIEIPKNVVFAKRFNEMNVINA